MNRAIVLVDIIVVAAFLWAAVYVLLWFKKKWFDKNWSIVDIGAFSIYCKGKSEILKNGDRIYFVTSKGQGEWLLYLDARQKEAKGCGGWRTQGWQWP